MQLLLALFIALIVLFIYLYNLQRTRKQGAPLPPGPPPEPILGHLRIYPHVDSDRRLHELSKVYGDIMHFNVLGKSIIVLSSEQAASDLLDKRSANYSDRPHFPAFDLLGWSDLLVFTRYGPNFHRARKLLQQSLTRSDCVIYEGVQLEQAHMLVKRFLEAPHDIETHVQRFSASIIMQIAYGHEIKSDGDRYIKLAQEIDESVELMSGSAALQLFPFLKHLPSWFPGAWFIRYAQETQHLRDEMVSAPFEQVVHELSSGEAKNSFTAMHLEELQRDDGDNEEDLDLLRRQAMHLWTGGAGTTASALLTFIFAMLIYPEVQKKAQQEIDQVLGTRRLPDFSDRESLPYVECVLQECKRWRPVFPLGIPHCVMEDDVYKGMFIPKGATVMVNATALSMDENIYSDPHAFRPERFLPDHGEPHPKGGFFGFGRRICVGRHLADNSLWIAAVSILATCDILKVKDKFGNEVVPEVKFTSNMICHPEPFDCRIEPRTLQAKTLVAML